MTDKPFKRISEQLELLEHERNLTMLNRESTEIALRRYGYYEIINGYKTPFLNTPDNDENGYKDTATFEHIYALYTLDKDFRNAILQGIEQFEQTFKQTLAYTVAGEISDNQKYYARPSHYNKGESHLDRKGHFKGTDRDKLLKKFSWLLQSDKQPIQHYRVAHHNIPPWILVKSLTFGESIYWYKLCKKDVREKIIAKMLDFDQALIVQMDPVLKVKQAFGDILSLFLDYRNLTAHGGRVYNHRSKKHALKWSSLIYRKNIINISKTEFSKGIGRSSIGALVQCLMLFENHDPYTTISIWLNIRIEEYLKKYPEDKDFLIQETELFCTNVLKISK